MSCFTIETPNGPVLQHVLDGVACEHMPADPFRSVGLADTVEADQPTAEENREAWAVVAAVAQKEPRNNGFDDGFGCFYCDAPEETPHDPSCPWMIAKKLIDGELP